MFLVCGEGLHEDVGDMSFCSEEVKKKICENSLRGLILTQGGIKSEDKGGSFIRRKERGA